jgi:O-antigen/teichoic acid export membrane protein
VLVIALQFATIAMLAAHLRPAGLGVYTFALAAAGLLRLIPNFGLVPVLARDVAQQPEREPQLVTNVIYMRVLLGVLAYGVLIVGLDLLDFGDANTRAARIAGLILLLGIDSFRSSLEIRLRVGWLSFADSVEAGLALVATLLLVLGGAGLDAFVWLYVAQKTFNALFITVVARRVGSFDWRLRRELWSPVLRAAIPLGFAGLLMALYYRLDIVLLAHMKSAGDVGQYGAAYRFLDAFGVLPAMTMTVLAPVFSRSLVEGRARLQRRYSQAMHLATLAALFVAFVGGATAWRVLPVLPGFARYDGAGIALSILCPASALILLGTIVQGTLVSGHMQRRVLLVSAAGLAVNVALNLALIPPFSYTGAAIATTATEAVLLTLSAITVRRRLGLVTPLDRWWRFALTLLGTGAVLAPSLALPALVQFALATLAFLVFAVLTGSVRFDDLRPFVGRSRIGSERVATRAGLADGAVVIDGPRSAWRALSAVGACEIHCAGDRPGWLLPLARAAGCREVVVVEHAAEPRRRRGLDARVVAQLADEVRLEPKLR